MGLLKERINNECKDGDDKDRDMKKNTILKNMRILIAGDHKESLLELKKYLPLCFSDVAISSESVDKFIRANQYNAIILNFVQEIDIQLLNYFNEKDIPIIILVTQKFSKETFRTTFYERNWHYVSRNKIKKIQCILSDIFQESQNKGRYLNWYKRLCRLNNGNEIQIMNENPEFWGSLYKY
jgi:hypothetical protein